MALLGFRLAACSRLASMSRGTPPETKPRSWTARDEGDGDLIQENCCVVAGRWVLMKRIPGAGDMGRDIKAA